MYSFFQLVEKIQAETYQDLCADENEYEEEVDEEHEDFWGEDKWKTFEQLIEDEIEEQKSHRQPYIQALLSLLKSQSEPEFNINERDPESDCTILMKIVMIGKLDLVQTLVEAGADVNAQTKNGSFALQVAAKNGWLEIFNYLAPLTNRELYSYAEEELPRGLLQRQRIDNYAVSAFTNAATCGNLQAVSEAIANGIDVNAINYYGYAALHRACWMGQTPIVAVLLEAGANPNLYPDDNQGFPPLMQTLDNPPFQIEIFRMLIKAGANVNCRSYDNVTPLMMAVGNENLEAVQLLIDAGSDVNATVEGLTALEIAKENNSNTPSDLSSDILKLLLAVGTIE